ncbi:MAG: adenosine deaminase [Treponema sp.]|nr:adenosine deaminase [Treponema sp.]
MKVKQTKGTKKKAGRADVADTVVSDGGMSKQEFVRAFREIPKAELHLHLEAVISRATIRKFYLRRYPGLSEAEADQEIAKIFNYADLNGFIRAYLAVQDLYDSEDDFDCVFADLKDYLVRNGVVYAEVFTAPSAFIKKGFDFGRMVEIYRRNIQKIKAETGRTIRILIDVSRTFGMENAEKNLQLLLAYRIPEIIGIGLGGSEEKGPAKLFGAVFDKARDNSLYTVAHAGEDVGPESIWDAIDILHSDRIGHGISAIQDVKLMETLAERKIPLEISPTSNVFTRKFVTKLSEHPMKTFYDKGIIVTLNSDDPLFFGVELLDEYWNAYTEMGFGLSELKQLVRNSFTSSFLPDDVKGSFLESVETVWEGLGLEHKKKRAFELGAVKRAMLMIGVPVAAFFVLTTVIAAELVSSFTRRQTRSLMQEQAQECVLKLEKELVAPKKMTEALALFFKDGFSDDDEANRNVFVKMSMTYPNLPGFYCGLTTRKTYSSPNIVFPDTYDPTSRGWYKGAVEQGGGMYYSDVYPDSQTNELVITLSKAVYKQGSLDGVVSFDYTLTELVNILADSKADEGDESFILSPEGKFFMHESYSPDDSMLEVEGGLYRDIAQKILASGDGFVEGKFGSSKYLFRVSVMPTTGWYYVLGRPVSSVNAFSNRMRLILSVSFFILFVIIMMITTLIMGRMRAKEKGASERLIDETQKLADSSRQNAATAQDQSAAVKEIVATMEDNTALSESISRKIKDVSSVANKTSGDVAEGVSYLEENVRQLRDIDAANRSTIDGIKNLGDKIESIWNIVTLINSVADQAKIIAFNAELEASAAGEAGKNFHIVASEIRRLANGIIDGTKEIKEQIGEIQQSSDTLILASESGTEKIKRGVDNARSLELRFGSIKNASEITADSAGDITTIIQQQTAASEQILITLRQIAAGVESFGGATENISIASQKLQGIAEELAK